MTRKKSEGDWKMDDNGKFSNRSIAEMIATSLFYAKPPVIVKSEYDRVVDIVEEELIVIDSHGEHWRKRQQEGSQPQGGGYSPPAARSPKPTP